MVSIEITQRESSLIVNNVVTMTTLYRFSIEISFITSCIKIIRYSCTLLINNLIFVDTMIISHFVIDKNTKYWMAGKPTSPIADHLRVIAYSPRNMLFVNMEFTFLHKPIVKIMYIFIRTGLFRSMLFSFWRIIIYYH